MPERATVLSRGEESAKAVVVLLTRVDEKEWFLRWRCVGNGIGCPHWRNGQKGRCEAGSDLDSDEDRRRTLSQGAQG